MWGNIQSAVTFFNRTGRCNFAIFCGEKITQHKKKIGNPDDAIAKELFIKDTEIKKQNKNTFCHKMYSFKPQ